MEQDKLGWSRIGWDGAGQVSIEQDKPGHKAGHTGSWQSQHTLTHPRSSQGQKLQPKHTNKDPKQQNQSV